MDMTSWSDNQDLGVAQHNVQLTASGGSEAGNASRWAIASSEK